MFLRVRFLAFVEKSRRDRERAWKKPQKISVPPHCAYKRIFYPRRSVYRKSEAVSRAAYVFIISLHANAFTSEHWANINVCARAIYGARNKNDYFSFRRYDLETEKYAHGMSRYRYEYTYLDIRGTEAREKVRTRR